MGHKFAEIAFTPSVRAVQDVQGSHDDYAYMFGGDTFNHVLGEREASFIQTRDSFYMASISESGWPYIQHRGGPKGFMKVIDEKTIGFADFRGNRQYISTGNILSNNRVALFFMDYPNRTRLKVLGQAEIIDINQADIISKLEDNHYRAHVERGVIIHIDAFDWNCPQHITPRFTDAHNENPVSPSTDNKTIHSTNAYPNELGLGPLSLVITGVRQLSSHVRAYELRDKDRHDLPTIDAGAHLQIPVQLENGETVQRYYSICSNPARRDIYEIAVLDKKNSSGGSHAIHRHFNIGMVLHCEYPQNHFSLHKDNRPAILIAGGIGITPIKSMAQSLHARGTHFHLHYAGRHRHDMAFRDRLERELGNAISIYGSADGEHMDINQVLTSASEDSVIYVCGPGRLIDGVIDAAEKYHIDPQRLRFERFTSVIPGNAKPVTVKLHRSNKKLYVRKSQTILDAMLMAGISVASNCRAGSCKTCAVKVIEGQAEHHDTALSHYERDELKLMCPCVSRATTETLILDI